MFFCRRTVGFHVTRLLTYALGDTFLVEYHREPGTSVAHHSLQQGRCVEVIVLGEGVELPETVGIQADVDVHRALEPECLGRFVGQKLEREVLEFLQFAVCYREEPYLGVRLDAACQFEGLGRLALFAVAQQEVGELVVAVVHQETLEVRLRKMFEVNGQEGQRDGKRIAGSIFAQGCMSFFERKFRPFGGYGNSGCRLCGFHRLRSLFSIRKRLRTAHRAVRQTAGRRLFGVNVSAGTFVGFVRNDHKLGNEAGDFESVLIFHHRCILAAESGHTASADSVQKSYFISYLYHSLSFLRCKNKANFSNIQELVCFLGKKCVFLHP